MSNLRRAAIYARTHVLAAVEQGEVGEAGREE
jgi:hypothetical protein